MATTKRATTPSATVAVAAALAQKRNYHQHLANFTTNLILSLYPINQIVKLIQLAPRKHNQQHAIKQKNDGKNATTNQQQPKFGRSTKNEIINFIDNDDDNDNDENHDSTLINPTTKNSNTKPRHTKRHNDNKNQPQIGQKSFSKSDLLNINQIHAASLNGLTSAGSFGSPTTLTTTNNNGHLGLVTSTIQQQQQQQAQVLQDQQASTSNLQEQNRKASQSSSVSQFVLPPQSSQAPPSVVEIVQASHANGLQPQVMRVRPANQVPSASTSSTPTALLEVSTAGNNRQQQASTISTNKFTFNSIASSPAPTMNPANFGESTPLATNSISVHSPTINQQQQQQQHVFNSAQPASTTSSSTTTSTVSLPGAHQHTSQSGAHQQHQQHVLSSQQQNVLASFSPTPSRAAHNTLASAKYSLDGIIAVAIFGGFIFLGAIITIIVIIIRR